MYWLITKATLFYGILAWSLTGEPIWQQAWGNSPEVLCKGTLGKLVVQRLRVPRGHTCHLRGTTVRGNITIEPKATLRSTGGQIQGNIRTYQGHHLDLDPQTWVKGRILNLPKVFQ